MDKKETIRFMDRIKSHYQEFVIDDFKISEWYGKLKYYDSEDVNKKLDEHLASEEYGDSIPKIYFLTKYLIPTEEKGKIKHYTIYCPKCGYDIPDEEINHHTKRCYEASTIVRDFKRYFYKNLQKSKLMSLPDEEFEKLYQEYMNKMLSCERVEIFRKRILIHIMYPEYTDNDINKIIKQMVGKEEKHE